MVTKKKSIVTKMIETVEDFFKHPDLPKTGWRVLNGGEIRHYDNNKGDHQCLISALKHRPTDEYDEVGERYKIPHSVRQTLVEAADHPMKFLSGEAREVKLKFMKRFGLREPVTGEEYVSQSLPDPS